MQSIHDYEIMFHVEGYHQHENVGDILRLFREHNQLTTNTTNTVHIEYGTSFTDYTVVIKSTP